MKGDDDVALIPRMMPNRFYLDDVFDDFMFPTKKENDFGRMKCDIYEKDNVYHLEMDIPGFDKKDVVEYIRTLSGKFDEEIKKNETENNSLKSKLSNMEAENKNLKEKLDSADLKIAGLEAENLSLKQKLEAVGDNPVQDKELLESEVERLTGELAEASKESEKATLEIANIVIKAEQISKRLRDEAIANATLEKEAIERQIVSKKSELMGISGEIERMKSVFADLYKKYVKE